MENGLMSILYLLSLVYQSKIFLTYSIKDEKRMGNQDTIRFAALVINTADYCSSTITQLEEKIIEKIHPDYKTKVDYTKERESFLK